MEKALNVFEKIIGGVNDAMYSYLLIIVLLIGGIYFTVRTRFVQFRGLKEQFRAVSEKNSGTGVSSFQALMVSTASRVGTGNIIGVSTALCMGGFGSAPNASASADVSHPAKQGLVQVLSVFIDTLIICSATAFMCMCSEVEPSVELSGAMYIQEALKTTLGSFGPVFITAAMIMFAFTTLLGNLFYVDQCIAYLVGHAPSKLFMLIYRAIAVAVIALGAGLSADMLWNIADVTMGLMTLINMPVIAVLGKYAFAALRDYESQRKLGKDPEFKAKNIGLPYKTDYWN